MRCISEGTTSRLIYSVLGVKPHQFKSEHTSKYLSELPDFSLIHTKTHTGQENKVYLRILFSLV